MKKQSTFDKEIERLTRKAIEESLLTIERIFVTKYRVREPRS